MNKLLYCLFLFFLIQKINTQAITKLDKGDIVRIENFYSKWISERNIYIWLPQVYNIKISTQFYIYRTDEFYLSPILLGIKKLDNSRCDYKNCKW